MPSRSLSSADTGKDFSPLDSKIRYERILVPHDGSEMSDKALKHAVYLSKISGTEIVFLHVLERKSREIVFLHNFDGFRRLIPCVMHDNAH
jgi:hypothetical protein